MVEQLAAWAGAHALEIFLALLVVLLTSVYLAWGVIASAYGSFENLVVRFGEVLGVRMNTSPRRVLLPVVIMTLSLVPLHIMIELSEEIAEEESILRLDEEITFSGGCGFPFFQYSIFPPFPPLFTPVLRTVRRSLGEG